MKELAIRTHARNVLIDITDRIAVELPATLCEGLCHIFTPHTTCALTINENADPAVRHDLIAKLDALIPQDETYYQHGEGNSDAHLKASLLGFMQSVPVRDGQLDLGTWQGIYLAEFDGPRTRRVRLYFQAFPTLED